MAQRIPGVSQRGPRPWKSGHWARCSPACPNVTNRWQAEDQREDLADLYVESADTKPGEECRSRESFLRRLADDVRRPGFDMMIAEATQAGQAPALAGCAFGFPVRRDGSWWQGFSGALPQDVEQLTASGHVFAITEILVHPHERDRRLAGHLQERPLTIRQASLGATLVAQADRVAVLPSGPGGGRTSEKAGRTSDRRGRLFYDVNGRNVGPGRQPAFSAGLRGARPVSDL
ncbi:hypothetical protein ACFWAT_01695 [Streptomyces syringium]|uniref:hypothetical protein n=1 Tax=Streptomyces syringium TaxID=76729 RepID=UPI00365B30C1